MSNSIDNLLYEFKKIKRKGWIQSCARGSGRIGVTFEKELGNSENNLALPDYQDIEIKCIGLNTIYPITLFSTIFDGPSNCEVQRIVSKYGRFDSHFPGKKTLYASLCCQKAYLVYNKYYFKLEINRVEEKIYLVIYDINYNLIEKISYISFKTIESHLIKKLSKLAIVYALNKYENHSYYFNYFDISIYTLKSVDDFLNLLEKDYIQANVAYRIMKSVTHYGKPSSKNIVFTIKLKYIPKLFSKVSL